MKVYINIYHLFEIIHLNERKCHDVLNVSILLRRHDIFLWEETPFETIKILSIVHVYKV